MNPQDRSATSSQTPFMEIRAAAVNDRNPSKEAILKRQIYAICALAIIGMAVGCKEKERASIVGGKPKSPSAAPATAEQVAKEARGNVSCPAKASVERPASAPVDDVVGVRPGMPLDEAAHFVLCDNPLLVVTENTSRGYNITTYGQHVRQGFDAKFAEPRLVKTSAQILSEMQDETIRRGGNSYVAPLKPGQTRYFVSSMGLPGQEQVMSVAREEYFQDGKLPTVTSVKQALIGKYGEPSKMSDSGTTVYLWWEYDPAGARIGQNSPRAGECRMNVSPDSGTSLSTDCGIQIGALIQSARENPGLARSLAVTSQDGARGYAILRNTEEALRKGDEARKSKELSDASKSANAPKL